MRKTVLAATLALAFPIVQAQQAPAVAYPAQGTSSGTWLEMYGVFDIGVERLDIGDQYATRISSGIASGSRLGFRGRENLGGGYTALFNLEIRFEGDNGTLTNRGPLYFCGTGLCPGVTLMPPATALPAPNQTAILGGNSAVNANLLQAVGTVNSVGALFDRQAFAGLITPYGAFLLGRQYTPGYEILNRFNAFGDSTAGQLGQMYSVLAIRANNAIQYRAEMSGFTGSLMYGFGGTDVLRNERSTAPTGGDDFLGLNLYYTDKAFSVGAGYNRSKAVTFAAPTESHTGLKTFNVGGWLALGDVKLFAQHMTRKNDNPVLRPEDIQSVVISTGGNLTAISGVLGALFINQWDVDSTRGLVGPADTKIYHLGLTWTAGRGTWLLAFNHAKDTARSSWATEDASVDHYAAAYFYNLSLRTQLYSAYAIASNKGQARVALGGAGYAGGWTTDAGQDSRALQVGIRHAF